MAGCGRITLGPPAHERVVRQILFTAWLKYRCCALFQMLCLRIDTPRESHVIIVLVTLVSLCRQLSRLCSRQSVRNTPDHSLPLTTMSAYPAPPPSYQAGNGAKKYAATDESATPLLGHESPRAGPSAGGYYDQPDGDVPDDFKVSFPPLLSGETKGQRRNTVRRERH